MTAQSSSDALIGAIVKLFVDQLAPALAERLRTEMARAPRYATARENPLGSRRAFLDAHREGAFPTFRRGREIAADWIAVEEWMRKRAAPPASTPPANDGAPTIDDMVAACAAPRRRRGRSGG